MNLYLNYENYSPLFILITGTCFFLSLYPIGKLTLRFAGIRVISFFEILCSFSVGLVSLSLIVQVAAMARLDGFDQIIKALAMTMFLLALYSAYELKAWVAVVFRELKSNKHIFYLVMLLFTGLIVSMAPLTKHDEIYYHALVPSRILHDGALNYYLWPWVGAILPQMIFQIASVVPFAIGQPNAANVACYCFSVLLACFVYKEIKDQTSAKYAAIITTGIMLGFHFFVSHVTLGAHAYGDFSFVLLTAFVFFKRHKYTDREALAICAFLSVATIGSKASYAPVVLATLAYAVYVTISGKIGFRVTSLNYLILPIAILFVPLVIFTFYHSGSPFGPLLAGKLAQTPYDLEILREQLDVYSSKLPYLNVSFKHFIQMVLLDFSVITSVALIAFLFTGFKTNKQLLFLYAAQAVVVYLKLPHYIRFLGGFTYLIPMVFWTNFYHSGIFKSRSKLIFVLSCLSLFIYAGAAVIGVYRFVPVVLGMENIDSFLSKNVAMFDDLKRLDEMLPKKSVVLIAEDRATIVASYMPRPVLYNLDDYKFFEKYELFLLGFAKNLEKYDLKNWQLGEKVYENPDAKSTIFRKPFSVPLKNHLVVYRLNYYPGLGTP